MCELKKYWYYQKSHCELPDNEYWVMATDKQDAIEKFWSEKQVEITDDNQIYED